MLIAFRGLSRVLVQDNSLAFPGMGTDLGQKGLIGPVPLSLWLFLILLVGLWVLLHRTGSGGRWW